MKFGISHLYRKGNRYGKKEVDIRKNKLLQLKVRQKYEKDSTELNEIKKNMKGIPFIAEEWENKMREKMK